MRLCRLFGIEVLLEPSWFVFIGLLCMLSPNPLIALAVMLLVFLSVLIHEFAHALTARRLYGIRTQRISLMMFGGIAHLETIPWGLKETVIGIAGPLCSLILAGSFYLISLVLDPMGVVGLFGFINLVLGGFNLLPIFPMDGGRILRGILCGCGTNIVLATKTCIVISFITIAIVFAVGLFPPSVFLIAILIIMILAGFAELRMVKVQFSKGEDI